MTLNSKEADVDVEMASKDAYLNNDIIDTFYWDKIFVKVKDKTTKLVTHLLDSIDGAASAGQSRSMFCVQFGLGETFNHGN